MINAVLLKFKDVKKVIVGQTVGELFYVVFSGQPLNILLTTARKYIYILLLISSYLKTPISLFPSSLSLREK